MTQTEFLFSEPAPIVKKKRIRTALDREKARARDRARYHLNLEETRAKAKIYRTANPEKIKRQQDRTRLKHHERTKERVCSRYQERKHEYRARYREWYKNNQAKIKDRLEKKKESDPRWMAKKTKAWRSANPELVSIALRRRKMKKITNSSIDDIRLADAKILAMRSVEFSECPYCDQTFRSKEMHVDHVFPISKGGGHSPCNVQLACVRCNCQKGSKILHEEWIPPNGR